MDYQRINVIIVSVHIGGKNLNNHVTEKYQLLAVKIDINPAYDLLSSSTSGQMSCLSGLKFILSQKIGDIVH